MGEQPLRAVLLDNNGTCFDDLHVAYGSACASLRAFGVTQMPTLQQYREQMNSRWVEWYRKYGMPAEVTRDQMNAVRKAYYAEHGYKAHYRPDLMPFILGSHRRGIRFAMVSAEIRSVLVACLDNDGFIGYFDDIRAEAWPKLPALVQALVHLRVMPEDSVYIDDSEEGIESAKSIGMRTIGFINPTAYASEERIRAAKPDECAKDFDEAYRIISRWS